MRHIPIIAEMPTVDGWIDQAGCSSNYCGEIDVEEHAIMWVIVQPQFELVGVRTKSPEAGRGGMGQRRAVCTHWVLSVGMSLPVAAPR